MQDDAGPAKDDSDALTSINWKKEIILVIVSAVIGGVVFSAVSPFIVPWIHDVQVNQFEAQNPTLGIEVEYAENVEGARYRVPDNETYDRYTLHIQNPSRKEINTLTVGLLFPGAIEYQKIGASQPANSISHSRDAWLVATDQNENYSYTTNAVKIDQLPPKKEVSVTFLIDRTPEKAPMPGYWGTEGLTRYNATKGTVMISGHYQWYFKGSIYTETSDFTLLNESDAETRGKYDICIGKKVPEICSA